MTTTIAQTIVRQLGRAMPMLGASQMVARENGLQFKFEGCRKANKIVITLADDDTYTVEFWKVTRMTFTRNGEMKGGAKKVKEVSEVYVEDLHGLIERVTGLYTRL